MDQGLEQFARGGQHYNGEVKGKKKEESNRSNKGRHEGARNVLGQTPVYAVRSGAQEPDREEALASIQPEAVAGGSQCPQPAVPGHC